MKEEIVLKWLKICLIMMLIIFGDKYTNLKSLLIQSLLISFTLNTACFLINNSWKKSLLNHARLYERDSINKLLILYFHKLVIKRIFQWTGYHASLIKHGKRLKLRKSLIYLISDQWLLILDVMNWRKRLYK